MYAQTHAAGCMLFILKGLSVVAACLRISLKGAANFLISKYFNAIVALRVCYTLAMFLKQALNKHSRT